MTILPVKAFLTTEPVIIVSELIPMLTFIIAGKVVILFFFADTPILSTGTVAHRTCSMALREIVDTVVSALPECICEPGLIIRKTKLPLRIAVATALGVVLTDSIARVEVVKTGSITLLVPLAILLSPALVPTEKLSGWAHSATG